MQQATLKDVKLGYVALARYFGHVLPDDVLQMYADDLADLDPAAVLGAMAAARREPGRRFCPLPSDIRKHLTPSVDPGAEANDIAGRITGSISRFGYTNADRAQAHIGPVGWQVVERMGGWAHLCRTLNAAQTGTFYAQARDLAKATLARAGQGAAARPLPAPRAPHQLDFVATGTVLADLCAAAAAR